MLFLCYIIVPTDIIIISNWAKEKVFINERLKKFKRTLFSQIKFTAKGKQCKYICGYPAMLMFQWEKNEIIKIRSSEDTNVVS